MKSITFIDTEISIKKHNIADIGGINQNNQSFHSASMKDAIQFMQGSLFLCGHNLIHHDLKYLQSYFNAAGLEKFKPIDTLYWSPLLFPRMPYHALVKDDKLYSEEKNNPLNDAIKAKDLFYDEILAFQELDKRFQRILYTLLHEHEEFNGFFEFIDYANDDDDVAETIRKYFFNRICHNADLTRFIKEYPVELAFTLALINTNSRYSIAPPWITKNYSHLEQMMYLLRSKPCTEGCHYCDQALDANKALRRFFGYTSYRTYASEPLQERAVKVAIDNKSLLAVFPTGGGKSII